MEKLLKKLNQAIKAYIRIQETHLTAFDTNLMPDLEAFSFERARAFADLKNNLDHFLNILHDEDHLPLIVVYQNQLTDIMKTDKQLSEKIKIHRDSLKQHLGKTREAQTAIRGYARSARSTGLKPLRFSG